MGRYTIRHSCAEQIRVSKCLGTAPGIDFYPIARQQIAELVLDWKEQAQSFKYYALFWFDHADIPDVQCSLYHAIY